jgi:hypothetical protein
MFGYLNSCVVLCVCVYVLSRSEESLGRCVCSRQEHVPLVHSFQSIRRWMSDVASTNDGVSECVSKWVPHIAAFAASEMGHPGSIPGIIPLF